MRRVLLAGTAVAVGGGVLLGTTIALGWMLLAVLVAVAGAAGAAWVALATPPARAPARGATVTLGLPLREVTAAVAATPEAAPDLEPGLVRLPDVEPDTGRAATAAA